MAVGMTKAHDVASALLYRDVKPADTERLETLRFNTHAGYGFASGCHVIPLGIAEFAYAARHYPIVFNDDEHSTPVALVGVTARHNLFVSPSGDWADGCYIPAFIRRYPFIPLRAGEGGEARMFVDVSAPHFNGTNGRRLVENGEATALLAKVEDYISTFEVQISQTLAFAKACEEQDLFAMRSVDYPLPDNRKLRLRGFKVIDMERLRALSEDAVIDWWRKGYLSYAEGHVTSLGNFGRLFHRARSQAQHG